MNGALTLTVDSSAKPIDLISTQQAVSQIASDMDLGLGKFQILESDESVRWRSKNLDIATPLIVMFAKFIELEEREYSRVSKRVLFARDKYTCQYCGEIAHPGQAHSLTLDHVKPLHLFVDKNAANTWENCVTACRPCNLRKGGRLPRECKMMPRKTPRQPHYVQLRFAGRLSGPQRDYIMDYYGEKAQEWL